MGGGSEPTASLTITRNGTYSVVDFGTAVVNVPNPSSGTKSITTNGTYDVKNYASVDVNVQGAELARIPVRNDSGVNITAQSLVVIDGKLSIERISIQPGETKQINGYYNGLTEQGRGFCFDVGSYGNLQFNVSEGTILQVLASNTSSNYNYYTLKYSYQGSFTNKITVISK